MNPPGSDGADAASRVGGRVAPQAGWLGWWRARGATTQAALPGAYAWAVTVASVGWSRGASTTARVAATLGLLILALGPALERLRPDAARMAIGWGLVMTSLATWVLVPDAAIRSFDAGRGIAGMFGWGLFAFAVASPTRPPPSEVVALDARPGGDRGTLLDTTILVLATGLAALLQIPGWRIGQADRALLVRLVALAGGLAILTIGGTIAVGRRGPRDDATRRHRIPVGLVAWPTIAAVLVVAGATYEVWRSRP